MQGTCVVCRQIGLRTQDVDGHAAAWHGGHAPVSSESRGPEPALRTTLAR